MTLAKHYFLITLFTILFGLAGVPTLTSAQEEVIDEAPIEEAQTLPESKTVLLDERTVARGLTIGAANGAVILAIPPKSLSAAGAVSMSFQSIDSVTVRDEYTAPEWTTTITLDDGVSVAKSLVLVYKIDQLELVPVIARWDEARMEWVNVPTLLNWKKKEARTFLKQMGMYALFLDTAHHVKGRATWYPDRLSKDSPLACASNEYPLRTKLKVTNIQTNESVVVQVQSVGPFVKGRIIDLTHTAFSKIGYPRKQGVLEVVVEPVEKK